MQGHWHDFIEHSGRDFETAQQRSGFQCKERELQDDVEFRLLSRCELDVALFTSFCESRALMRITAYMICELEEWQLEPVFRFCHLASDEIELGAFDLDGDLDTRYRFKIPFPKSGLDVHFARKVLLSSFVTFAEFQRVLPLVLRSELDPAHAAELVGERIEHSKLADSILGGPSESLWRPRWNPFEGGGTESGPELLN